MLQPGEEGGGTSMSVGAKAAEMLKWLATSIREDDRDLAVRITDDPLATIHLKSGKTTEIYSINRYTHIHMCYIRYICTYRDMNIQGKCNVNSITQS